MPCAVSRPVTYVPTIHSRDVTGFRTRTELLTRFWQINWRMRVTLNDGRAMTGQMLAFDKVWRIVRLIRKPS